MKDVKMRGTDGETSFTGGRHMQRSVDVSRVRDPTLESEMCWLGFAQQVM